MSLYLRLLLMFFLPAYAEVEQDSGLSSGDVSLSVDEKDINVLGRSLAKQCGWQWVNVDKGGPLISLVENYPDCQEALRKLQLKYSLSLFGGRLSSVPAEGEFSYYQPEYQPVSAFKKQLKAWLSSKLLKTFGFFEDSGFVYLSKEKKELIRLLDVPPRQLHLRAIVWVADQKLQSHMGFSAEKFSHMGFDQWLEHLHWLQGEGSIKVLAQPELFMINNKKAVVYSGEEIPYVSSSAKRPQVLFKKALLSLSAKTSHIGERGASLEVEITFDKASENQYHGNVGIARQMVKSSLRLPFYTSRVMGGVRQNRQSVQKYCLPIISGFPVIGAAFCETATLERQSILYVMIMISPVSDEL